MPRITNLENEAVHNPLPPARNFPVRKSSSSSRVRSEGCFQSSRGGRALRAALACAPRASCSFSEVARRIGRTFHRRVFGGGGKGAAVDGAVGLKSERHSHRVFACAGFCLSVARSCAGRRNHADKVRDQVESGQGAFVPSEEVGDQTNRRDAPSARRPFFRPTCAPADSRAPRHHPPPFSLTRAILCASASPGHGFSRVCTRA